VNGSFSRILEPAAADVLAAGAVLWRYRDGSGTADRGLDGVEVALVHRPRYDDWSFPKGKLDTGETLLATAAREVHEETGQVCRLGAVLGDVRYEVPEGRKLVRYWAAEARGGEFTAGAEVDELRWADARTAAGLLSYSHDVEVLARFTDLGPPAAVVALVRHAKAGSRSQWEGDDDLRPLSGSGREQAQRLARLLPLFGPDRIVTAPPVRCRDTVAPVAEALGLPIAEEEMFGEEGYWKDPTAGVACLREYASRGGVTVVSSQGGVIPDLVGALVTAAQLPDVDPDDIRARKGSTWLLTFGPDGALRSADHYDRPT
jgi:8-oxo-dGTP diphosphatase